MPKASDIVIDKNQSLLLKSPPGFGKTIAAASFAVLGPIHISYFDKRSPSELKVFFKKIGREDLLQRIDYDIYGANNANEYLNRLYDYSKNGTKYVAEVTDSATTLTSAAVNWHLGHSGNRDPKEIGLPGFDEYKTETSLITQALDILRCLPIMNIWTCHPLPQIKMEADNKGKIATISTVTSIVTYGQKTAGIIPTAFTEVYHFVKKLDYSKNPTEEKRIVMTDMVGDDYAKTSLGLPAELDITNKLFAEVWLEAVKDTIK